MKNRILFEDENIVAVNKNAGELVVVDRWKTEPQENIILYWLGDYLRSKGHSLDKSGRDLYPLHRLDRETSGIVLLAKNEESHREFSLLFEKRAMEKIYWAFAIGIPEWDTCEILLPLQRKEGKSGRGRAMVHIQGGSEALTELKKLATYDDFSWIEAKPATGKLHQIRVHLHTLGHSIINDKQYGPKDWSSGAFDFSNISRMCLHARTISFLHPFTKEKIFLEAPLDIELRSIVNLFKSKRNAAR